MDHTVTKALDHFGPAILMGVIVGIVLVWSVYQGRRGSGKRKSFYLWPALLPLCLLPLVAYWYGDCVEPPPWTGQVSLPDSVLQSTHVALECHRARVGGFCAPRVDGTPGPAVGDDPIQYFGLGYDPDEPGLEGWQFQIEAISDDSFTVAAIPKWKGFPVLRMTGGKTETYTRVKQEGGEDPPLLSRIRGQDIADAVFYFATIGLVVFAVFAVYHSRQAIVRLRLTLFARRTPPLSKPIPADPEEACGGEVSGRGP